MIGAGLCSNLCSNALADPCRRAQPDAEITEQMPRLAPRCTPPDDFQDRGAHRDSCALMWTSDEIRGQSTRQEPKGPAALDASGLASLTTLRREAPLRRQRTRARR